MKILVSVRKVMSENRTVFVVLGILPSKLRDKLSGQLNRLSVTQKIPKFSRFIRNEGWNLLEKRKPNKPKTDTYNKHENGNGKTNS